MAGLNAKKRVFGSVFCSQESYVKSMNDSNKVHDQQDVDRSWLNLPPILNDSDLLESFKSSGRSDHRAFETLRDPQETLSWYTNRVRRHYLNQVFPIVQHLRTIQISRLIRILDGAHRLYFDRLGLILKCIDSQDVRTAAVRNFRLNLSTVVSKSIPDRSAIKSVVRKHVSAILNRSAPENDLLLLVRSLCSVGLGGEKYASVSNCSSIFNDSRIW
jgi:hypothetical protein